MNAFHIAVVISIILGIISAMLALDRRYFTKRFDETIRAMEKMCTLRHNPLDKAINEIKESQKRIWQRIDQIWDKMNKK